MIFEWDDHKEQINIAKHGIDFKTASPLCFRTSSELKFSMNYILT